jgi:muramoyltetrapeptide carboxypeptidase
VENSNSFLCPASLEPGDLIYITAPAKAIEASYVLNAKDLFERAGFRVEISQHCLGQHNYFSGTEEERLKDLQYGIDQPEIKAIVCAIYDSRTCFVIQYPIYLQIATFA